MWVSHRWVFRCQWCRKSNLRGSAIWGAAIGYLGFFCASFGKRPFLSPWGFPGPGWPSVIFGFAETDFRLFQTPVVFWVVLGLAEVLWWVFPSSQVVCTCVVSFGAGAALNPESAWSGACKAPNPDISGGGKEEGEEDHGPLERATGQDHRTRPLDRTTGCTS